MAFETAVVKAHPAGYETPLLALALPRGNLPASLGEVDNESGGAINRVLAAGDFSGKRDETAVVYPSGPAARVLLVGLGKPDEIDRSAIRRAAAVAAVGRVVRQALEPELLNVVEDLPTDPTVAWFEVRRHSKTKNLRKVIPRIGHRSDPDPVEDLFRRLVLLLGRLALGFPVGDGVVPVQACRVYGYASVLLGS
jgi:hypothetical protein